jgi:hypothetical protein
MSLLWRPGLERKEPGSTSPGLVQAHASLEMLAVLALGDFDRIDLELLLLLIDFILAELSCRDGALASRRLWLECTGAARTVALNEDAAETLLRCDGIRRTEW